MNKLDKGQIMQFTLNAAAAANFTAEALGARLHITAREGQRDIEVTIEAHGRRNERAARKATLTPRENTVELRIPPVDNAPAGGVTNVVSGATISGPLIQAGNISNLSFSADGIRMGDSAVSEELTVTVTLPHTTAVSAEADTTFTWTPPQSAR